MQHEVAIARAMLLSAGPSLARMVDRRLARDMLMFAGGGLAILRAIERVDYDVFRHRPKLGKFDYLRLGWDALRGRLPGLRSAADTAMPVGSAALRCRLRALRRDHAPRVFEFLLRLHAAAARSAAARSTRCMRSAASSTTLPTTKRSRSGARCWRAGARNCDQRLRRHADAARSHGHWPTTSDRFNIPRDVLRRGHRRRRDGSDAHAATRLSRSWSSTAIGWPRRSASSASRFSATRNPAARIYAEKLGHRVSADQYHSRRARGCRPAGGFICRWRTSRASRSPRTKSCAAYIAIAFRPPDGVRGGRARATFIARRRPRWPREDRASMLTAEAMRIDLRARCSNGSSRSNYRVLDRRHQPLHAAQAVPGRTRVGAGRGCVAARLSDGYGSQGRRHSRRRLRRTERRRGAGGERVFASRCWRANPRWAAAPIRSPTARPAISSTTASTC